MKPPTFYLVQVPNSFGTWVTQYRYRSRKSANLMAKKLSHSRVISLAALKQEKLAR